MNRRAGAAEATAAAVAAATAVVDAAESEQRQLDDSKNELLSKLTMFIKRPVGGAAR